MHIEINGNHIIGVDREILRAIVFTPCPYCAHKSITHREDGCKVVFSDTNDDRGNIVPDPCPCKRGYTSYLLLKDQSFIEEIIKEGILF